LEIDKRHVQIGHHYRIGQVKCWSNILVSGQAEGLVDEAENAYNFLQWIMREFAIPANTNNGSEVWTWSCEGVVKGLNDLRQMLGPGNVRLKDEEAGI
jgi:hypothetical protein